jgi:hypothetical protein
MKGPWQHPNGIWYYRGEVPRDLWDARERLASMGAAFGTGKEVRRSLGTRDRKAASAKHAEVLVELETTWSALREALRDGPARLSERNVVAIAGERSRRFVKHHEDNPSIGAVPPTRAEPTLPPMLLAEVDRLSEKDQGRLRRELLAALATGDRISADQLGAQFEVWSNDPVLSVISRALLHPVSETLVDEHEADLTIILKEHASIVDRESRAALLVAAAQFQARARKTLLTMASQKDYREPEWVKGLPKYRAAKSRHSFDAIIDAEAKRRSLGRDAKPLPFKTATSFKATCAKFASFRGRAGTNASTVTADELDKWKTDLMAAGKVSDRTVANWVGTIKTVLRWARGLFKGDFARIVGDLDQVSLPDFTPKPSDLSAIHPDEALIILRAARLQSDVRLRWLPWLTRVVASTFCISDVPMIGRMST